jgi:hypothetical protein
LAKLCSFQGPREGAPRIGARSLKTQQHEARELAPASKLAGTGARAPPGPADISVVTSAQATRNVSPASMTAPILELP